ncbi:unnamed protein product, partial [Brassica oleracea var. botrytis]
RPRQEPKKPRHSSLHRGKRHVNDRRDTCIDAELMGTRALKVITLIAGKRSSPELRPPEDEAVNTTRGLEDEATLSKEKRKQSDLLIESQSPQIQLGSGDQKNRNQTHHHHHRRTMKREESRLRRCF